MPKSPDAITWPGRPIVLPDVIGSGDPDAHVPVERVHESARILEEMNAKVHVQIHEGRPHSISPAEIEEAKRLIFS